MMVKNADVTPSDLSDGFGVSWTGLKSHMDEIGILDEVMKRREEVNGKAEGYKVQPKTGLDYKKVTRLVRQGGKCKRCKLVLLAKGVPAGVGGYCGYCKPRRNNG